MTFEIPMAPLLATLVIFLRIAFLTAWMPLIGDALGPVRIRIMVAIGITMILAPLNLVQFSSLPHSLPELAIGLLPEALIGMTMALIGRLMIGGIQIAGAMAGSEMGFSIANEVDPGSGIPVAVVAQLQYGAAIVVFLTTGAHTMFFQALADSFRYIPPFGAHAGESLFRLVNHAATRMFYLGVKINLPIVGTLICVNVAFAMLAKAVPQINVLLESFPIRIITGMVLLILSLGYFGVLLGEVFGEMGNLVRQVAPVLGGR